MEGKLKYLLILTAVLSLIGCGGTGANQSSVVTLQMELLQVDGEPLIQGTVFNDLDGDSVMDTVDPVEPGIEDVTVSLLDGDMIFLEATTTNASGHYAFAVSVGSLYFIEETDPIGYYSTTANIGSVNVTDMDIPPVNFGDKMIQEIPVDVKPGSSVNPLNLRSNGVLPVAILGTDEVDVADIDPASLLLNGIPPLRWNYGDVSGLSVDPYPDMQSDGGETGDGREDLTLKFNTQDIAGTLGTVQRGDTVTLTMDGELYDGTLAAGEETVWIVQVPK